MNRNSNSGLDLGHRATRQTLSYVSLLSFGLGLIGMMLSFGYLASTAPADIVAGASGFVAGALLIGSGIVSLALLARSESVTEDATPVSS